MHKIFSRALAGVGTAAVAGTILAAGGATAANAAPVAPAQAAHVQVAAAPARGLSFQTHPIKAKPGEKRIISGALCLVNSLACSAQLTGEGAGNQAQLSSSGADLTESNCGTLDGFTVVAWRNNNHLWVHYKTSNGFVTLESDTTNGCPNAADEWVRDPVGGGQFLYLPFNNTNIVMGTNSSNAGSPVFIAMNPAWNKWNG